ncbi:anti-virulence regulator CigR family protein [Pseudomonas putida]
MKLSKPLIASLGLALVGLTGLAHADQWGPGGPGGPDGHYDHRDDHRDHRDDRRFDHGGPPPRDFGPIRQHAFDHRGYFGRAERLPPGVFVVQGRPLAPGYGRPLGPRELEQLPYYPGYQWIAYGPDIVLIQDGTGVVYQVLQGVLAY